MNDINQLSNNLVVIDSNFILLPLQFKIDYLREISLNLPENTEFIIFKQVYDELEAKSSRESNKIKFQKQLKAGLLYLETNKSKYTIKIISETKSKEELTDDFLLKKSIELKKENRNVYLATNDQLLRKKAREKKIGEIFLRQKKYLSIVRP